VTGPLFNYRKPWFVERLPQSHFNRHYWHNLIRLNPRTRLTQVYQAVVLSPGIVNLTYKSAAAAGKLNTTAAPMARFTASAVVVLFFAATFIPRKTAAQAFAAVSHLFFTPDFLDRSGRFCHVLPSGNCHITRTSAIATSRSNLNINIRYALL